MRTKKAKRTTHSARLSHSKRLQRTLAFLGRRPKRGATTREIIAGAHICAVNSAVDELRDEINGGILIDCKPEWDKKTESVVHRYRLIGMKKPRCPSSAHLKEAGTTTRRGSSQGLSRRPQTTTTRKMK